MIIAVIAKAANNPEAAVSLQLTPDFYHEGRPFVLQIDLNIAELKSNVSKTSEFWLAQKINAEYASLCLFFKPSYQPDASTKNSDSKHQLIRQFFDVDSIPSPWQADGSCLKTDEEDQSQISIQDIYARLRDGHTSDETPVRVSDDRKPSGLHPALRFYQNDAVNWMLERELTVAYFPCEFVAINARDFCEAMPQLYYNPRTLEIWDRFPGDVAIPSGGILADEMGLGKTVEMLALILSNPPPVPKCSAVHETMAEHESASQATEKEWSKAIVMCVCYKQIKENLIECRHCQLYQHIACVGKFSPKPLHSLTYRCPACWENEEPVESAATFIVSPAAIKTQWQAEIQKHIAKADFKVLIYNGFKQSGWISPDDLANFDVVLADYNVMTTELHYVGNKRTSIGRRKPQFIRPVSPLTMVRWWRVCLDEAQMVETAVNMSSRMVKLLPAVHRWAISGTPIEKSISHLHGLLYFLDVDPYKDIQVWHRIAEMLQHGDAAPLICVLERIMWRTCKASVWDKIGIPPQTEIMHSVQLSDLEMFFYNSQHSQCEAVFREKTQRIKNEVLVDVNRHTLKKLMEPLRKLRQDCTVPTLLSKTDCSKRLLSPEELQKHLASKHEIECKSQLRSVASSLNGLAALHIIREEYTAAVTHYKRVLRWASDYTGSISVDTLLQVHALYNLIEILPLTDQNTVELLSEYRSALERLESKYMESSQQLIRKMGDQRLAVAKTIDSLLDQLGERSTNWWCEALHKIDDHDQLIERMYTEVKVIYNSEVLHSIRSVRGITFVLIRWLEDLEYQRELLQSAFDDLEFFSANIKPRSQQDDTDECKIEHLVQMALECHLNKNLGEVAAKKKKQTTLCQLCKVKHTLMAYECVLFNMKFNDDNERGTAGSWAPTFQETVLKVLLSQLKRDYSIDAGYIAKDGETHMQIIEARKNEFKEYSKYWVEINHAAAAYDELNMCKSRLKAVDPDAIEDQPNAKAIQNITFYEVDQAMEEHRVQLIDGEREFQRTLGTLKYLKHLEKNSAEPQICPICKQIPENKYCVLECGHHMCMVCLVQMLKFYKNYVDCSMCRRKQTIKEMYYVTISRLNDVLGDYSSKICDIIRTILALHRKDDRVKVILFSNWEVILNVIARALNSNGLTFRKKSSPFNRSVDDFKNEDLNVTVLLLPLSFGSKGLNLIEATHVFLVEPILNPAEELQAIGRVHRIGQTKPTFVHRFIVANTIEESIHRTISSDESGKWASKHVTIDELVDLFTLAEP